MAVIGGGRYWCCVVLGAVGLRRSPRWRSCAFWPSLRLHLSVDEGARLQLAGGGIRWRVVAGRCR